jgi:multiple sugar transport system substrate-binding protein
VMLVLPGCTGKEESQHATKAAIELTYWPAPNPQEVLLADSLVRIWNALHPDIQVRMQPIPVSISTEEVLLAAIAGKTTPDICSNIQPGALSDYTDAGGLVPLDQFPDFDSAMTSRMPAEMLIPFQSGDKHFYQVPWKTNPIMTFYNKRLLLESGFDHPPRTYSEFLAMGRVVSRDTTGDGEFDIWMGERDIRPIWWQRLMDFYPFYIAASGGRTLFENGAVAFENPTAMEVFQFFQSCYGEGIFPRTYFQGGDPFLLEKKAIHWAGPWEVAALQKFAPHLDYGVIPLPVPDDHTGPIFTYGDFKNISIFSTTQHPRESWEFVKFLVTPKHDLMLLEITDQMPVRGDLSSNPLFESYFMRSPIMERFAEQALYTRGLDAVGDLKEIFDAIAQAYERCAVYGKQTPAEAVHETASRVRAIMEWNR